MGSLAETELVYPADPEIAFDLIGIGFGPASLAVAVALNDILEDRAVHENPKFTPKLRFLERQRKFGWHTGMLLPGTKMQVSFIKDLATLRNPRSHFTFLNYLKEHNRLVQFCNLDTFLPFRIEFEDYLKWTARHFSDIVQYSQDVVGVKPLKSTGSSTYNFLQVTAIDQVTNQTHIQYARNVLVAIGGRPRIPTPFQECHHKIIHSSQYCSRISSVLPKENECYHIAVIGSGQSAAELFTDLSQRYPKSKTYLVMRDSSLRPSDDSPFVNEIFNPDAVDDFFSAPADVKDLYLKCNRSTNYGVVRLPLIEQIYESMYHQRLQDADTRNWQHRILCSQEIVSITDLSLEGRVALTLRSLKDRNLAMLDTLVVDAVVLATGYVRDSHNEILKDCQVINGSEDASWKTGRDYKVMLNREVVDGSVNIYLQGCNEQTHGLSDSLLSILAIRGGEIVESVFDNLQAEVDSSLLSSFVKE